MAHSIVSNKKTSTVSEGKNKAHHGSQAVGGKGAAAASSGDGTSQVSVLGRGEGSKAHHGNQGVGGKGAVAASSGESGDGTSQVSVLGRGEGSKAHHGSQAVGGKGAARCIIRGRDQPGECPGEGEGSNPHHRSQGV